MIEECINLHQRSPIVLTAGLLWVSDSGLKNPGKHLIYPC
jgi:hypothetical protein